MPRPDVSAERIPAILAAAAEVFAERGVDGASMNDVANAAGISKAAMYRYFPGKDALIEGLARQVFDADSGLLDVPSTGSVAAAILNYCDRLSTRFATQPRVFIVVAEFYARATYVPELHATIASYFHSYVDSFVALLRRAVDRGELRADTDVSRLALRLVCLIEGSILVAQNLDLAAGEVLRTNVAALLSSFAAAPEGSTPTLGGESGPTGVSRRPADWSGRPESG